VTGIGYALGFDALIVGVEDDPSEAYDDGSPVQRVYIDARYLNRFVVPVMEDARRIREAWDGDPHTHLTFRRPAPEHIYTEALS
jgi:hypothetical protein